MNRYLAASDVIDFGWQSSREVTGLARTLAARSHDETQYIKNAYEFVRDAIAHSADIGSQALPCKASDVLRAKEGICFAKSHLLAALLRCRGIPAGLCYQRLILDDETAPFLIYHGLNAVYAKEPARWIRLDARGNKEGVNARFSLREERLAFPVRPEKGEEDIPLLYAEPDRNIRKAFTENKTRAGLWEHLPQTLAGVS